MKKVLVISLIVLTTLIVLTFFLNNLFKKKPANNNTLVIPTSSFNNNYQDIFERGGATNPKSKLVITPMKQDELSLLTLSKSKLPIMDSDYEIKYSEILDKFVVYPKNDKGTDKINEWFKDNKIEDIVLKNNLYVISDKPVDEYIKEAEDNIVKNNEIARNQTGGNNGNNSGNTGDNEDNNNKDTNPTNPPTRNITVTKTVSPTTSKTKTTTGDHEYNQIDALADLLKLIEEIDLNVGAPAEPTVVPNNDTSRTLPPTSNPVYGQVPTSLTEIFSEVNQKVGVPIKILEATMRIECPTTFNLTADKIALYSQPGNGIPFCLPNVCSAAGPMQMTTGIDNKGSPTCSSCGLTSCPNAWASYGRAVNTYGGYSHQPNPLNIRDSVYGGAAKQKHDSGAKDANNWSQDEVYKAARSYYGSCSESYRYARLGNRTYCEFLWWYYKNN